MVDVNGAAHTEGPRDFCAETDEPFAGSLGRHVDANVDIAANH